MTPSPDRWTRLVTRVLAPNPGPMTLDGTNSFLISSPGADGVVVVDPGPEDAAHLERIAGFGRVELILITHHHPDHVEGVDSLVALTGAPVRAWRSDLCREAAPLSADEEIEASGTRIRVVATPGHTTDSVSFHLPEDTAPGGSAAGGTMLTGDTILGRGTTVIAHPDGAIGPYLASLDTLEAFGSIPVLPAHGAMLPDLAATCREYRAHRSQRLDQVRGVLAELGAEASDDPALVEAIVDRVYGEIDPRVRFAAVASTRAQLDHLAGSAP
ncbi:MBL fold metallo-hydrolase [Microbacterium flavescens]|uniref:MBL fold metallo-hydrolase n=1 Tax=Microbacterium flavescens TaxID=69366 RepID=UPI0027DB9258|nr:MBL fold metallo-hydrolase [Microbacterium flavescens]